jgi:hypothetical protein
LKKYAYAGPDPIPDGEGGIVRPGEVREMDELPPWGPWAEVAEDGAAPAAEPVPAKAPPAASKTASAKAPAPGEGE